ncbi:MAG: hypothetical protein RhofKO_08070 [Rhodothermales bacterium]
MLDPILYVSTLVIIRSMAELIAHIVVYDDLRRLALNDATLHVALRDALTHEVTAGKAGSVSRMGKDHIPRLLAQSRDRLNEGTFTEADRRRLGFTLGWIAHQAADNHLKPIYRELQPEHYSENRPSPSDIRIYHDTVLMQEVDHLDAEPQFPASVIDFAQQTHAVAASVDVPRMEAAFDGLIQSDLYGLQTDPKPTIHDRIGHFITRVEPVYISTERYAQAYQMPDPTYLRRFIHAPVFYDRADSLIALARAIQTDQVPETALADARAQPITSTYGRVIELGLQMIDVATAFLHGTADQDAVVAAIATVNPA